MELRWKCLEAAESRGKSRRGRVQQEQLQNISPPAKFVLTNPNVSQDTLLMYDGYTMATRTNLQPFQCFLFFFFLKRNCIKG